jgi:hypothetical protein
MADRLTTSKDLKPGDVCMVAVQLRDKTDGSTFWWKRFAAVVATHGRHAEMLTLKPQLDLDRDLRMVEFDRDVVTKLEEYQYPQGVIAMRMKYITLGHIKIGDV